MTFNKNKLFTENLRFLGKTIPLLKETLNLTFFPDLFLILSPLSTE